MFADIVASLFSAIRQTSLTEWLIFVFALLYVVLASIERVWCWLFGILASGFSVYLCYTGRLFLESALQVFYVFMGIYGWYEWLYGNKKKLPGESHPVKTELSIVSWPFSKNIYLFLCGCMLWIPFGYLAHRYSTQALPYLDAFITAFSLVATWMTARKILENWIYWIIIDALAVILYASRDFYLIALLYFIYTILALVGYFQWKKRIQTLSA